MFIDFHRGLQEGSDVIFGAVQKQEPHGRVMPGSISDLRPVGTWIYHRIYMDGLRFKGFKKLDTLQAGVVSEFGI